MSKDRTACRVAARSAAAVLCLLLATAGCATGRTTQISTLAADYLAIATPANHRLDVEVDGYADNEHHDLAAAESALRAQAATERWFDRHLIKIRFLPRLAATARALVLVNQRRVALTLRQAQSPSIPVLLSFDGSHKAADAAVEAQVRIIRRALGLPPPGNS